MKRFGNLIGLLTIAAIVGASILFLHNRTNIGLEPATASNQLQELPTEIPPTHTPYEPIVVRTVIAPPTLPPPIDPTPKPTPVATRVPVAQPPFIPGDLPKDESFTVVYAEGDLIKAISSESGAEARTLVDVKASTGLFLGKRENGGSAWADVSPDGSQIAVVLTDIEQSPIMDGGFVSPNTVIYLLDVATQKLEVLIEHAFNPIWSPDSTSIAYLDAQTRGLKVMNFSDRSQKDIWAPETSSESVAEWITWSADGKQIAFVQTWSAYANSGGIWVADLANAGGLKQLVEKESNAADLDWSPNSDQILYLTSYGDRDVLEGTKNLWIVGTVDGAQQQLTRNMTIYGQTWSKEGKWILFTGTHHLEGENPLYDLWLLSADGVELKRLTDELDTDHFAPQWSQHNAEIIFRKAGVGIFQLGIADGSQREILNTDANFVLAQ
ncbi:MAG: hypothetical protein R3A44_35650 [Caldilineaceae bacterium]